jgi:hypothetical protein
MEDNLVDSVAALVEDVDDGGGCDCCYNIPCHAWILHSYLRAGKETVAEMTTSHSDDGR